MVWVFIEKTEVRFTLHFRRNSIRAIKEDIEQAETRNTQETRKPRKLNPGFIFPVHKLVKCNQRNYVFRIRWRPKKWKQS